ILWVFVGFVFLLTGAVFGDSVQQDQPVHSEKEGDSVNLTCTYSTSSSYINLHWYRKHPNGAPEYILQRGAKSNSGDDHTAEFAKNKFDSRTDSSTTTLTIKTVQLSDTALYYCALWIA
uniref:Ig-like domain-containing protein n=1 Tax=Latimeria chalumnae TaxID=7897 RepID=H3B254_LATCH